MTTRGSERKPYHHGDLRSALIAAAEAELTENGVDGFSLRATAKRAGVSHAAPAHHFRDAGALLDAVAAEGFARLTAAMKEEQAQASPEPMAQLAAAGIGYVRFAMANPQMFQLMFAPSRRGSAEAALRRNADAAFSVVVNAVGGLRGREAMRTEAGWRDSAACWAMAHGYAQLAVAGRMDFATGLAFERQTEVIGDLMRRAVSS